MESEGGSVDFGGWRRRGVGGVWGGGEVEVVEASREKVG